MHFITASSVRHTHPTMRVHIVEKQQACVVGECWSFHRMASFWQVTPTAASPCLFSDSSGSTKLSDGFGISLFSLCLHRTSLRDGSLQCPIPSLMGHGLGSVSMSPQSRECALRVCTHYFHIECLKHKCLAKETCNYDQLLKTIKIIKRLFG